MPRAKLKQRKDGRYKAVYKGKQFMGDTQAEAFALRDEYKRQAEAGLRDTSVTFSQYADGWLKTYKRNVSLNYYNDTLRYICAFTSCVGDKNIRDYVQSDIVKAYQSAHGKSKSYLNKYALTVKGVFSAAVADRLIPFNPCATVKPAGGTSGTHRAIQQWERDLVLRSSHRFAPAAIVMLYAGLRRGEVLALDVDRDVDFTAMTITVREAIRFEGGRPVLADPKTEAGSRTIPMLDVVASVLRGTHGLVAPAVHGGHMSAIAFKRAWDGFLLSLDKMCQLDNSDAPRPDFAAKTPIRTHDLRHSYCTMLYDAGIDLKTAQKWMGHADQAMTMRIYTHLTAEREEAAARTLREKINGQVQNEVQSRLHIVK